MASSSPTSGEPDRLTVPNDGKATGPRRRLATRRGVQLSMQLDTTAATQRRITVLVTSRRSERLVGQPRDARKDEHQACAGAYRVPRGSSICSSTESAVFTPGGSGPGMPDHCSFWTKAIARLLSHRADNERLATIAAHAPSGRHASVCVDANLRSLPSGASLPPARWVHALARVT